MTISLAPSRAFSTHILNRIYGFSGPKVTSSSNLLLRVNSSQNAPYAAFHSDHNATQNNRNRSGARTYATAPSKPKAHTGRVAAKPRKAAAAKASPATKTAAKKVAKATKAKKPAPRKKKVAIKKPKSTSKARPKRRVLTEKQKATADKKKAATALSNLKEVALLGKAPKKLPDSAYSVVNAEYQVKNSGKKLGELAKESGLRYRSLSPEEMESYNRKAVEAKAKNEIAQKEWLKTFTPLQIKEANNARLQLRRKAKAAGSKKQYNLLQDDRLVRQPVTPYAAFNKDRHASGDFAHMTIKEIAPLIAKEWKNLRDTEKKKYVDQFEKSRNQYFEEYQTVYGEKPVALRTPKN